MIDRYELVEKLQNGVVSVTFTKADGSNRKMKATLSDSFVSDKQLLTEAIANPDTIRVWDVDAGGWRSFRVASVKSVQ